MADQAIGAIIDSIRGAGADARGPVLDAIEAAKRYLDREADRVPAGPVPTLEEFSELIDQLRRWAILHAAPIDTAPLQAFRRAELRRITTWAPRLVPGHVSGVMIQTWDGEREWGEAAAKAEDALNDLKTWLVSRGATASQARGRRHRLRLRIKGQSVLLDGEPVPLDMTPEGRAKALCFLKHLIKEGGDWISGGDIDRAERDSQG